MKSIPIILTFLLSSCAVRHETYMGYSGTITKIVRFGIFVDGIKFCYLNQPNECLLKEGDSINLTYEYEVKTHQRNVISYERRN